MNKSLNAKKQSISSYLERLEPKVTIKIGVTVLLSFLLGTTISSHLNRPDYLISGLWCILAAIAVSQPHVGGTYRAAWHRFLGLLVGSTCGALFASWFGSSAFPLAISAMLTVALCALLNLSDSFRIAVMSVTVVMVLWSLHPETNPWIFGMYRFFDSCLGILVAVVVTQALWPAKAVSTVKSNLARSCLLLSELYLNATDLGGQSDALDKPSIQNDQELYALIHDNLDRLQDSEFEMGIEDLESWKVLTNDCEHLFDEITILRTLDKRLLSLIIDDSLAKHLEALMTETSSSFKRLAKQLEEKTWEEPSTRENIQTPLKELKEDLLRFRQTKTTRRFELKDVESFFVFFYTVELIASQLPPLEESIKKLLAGNRF